MIGLRLGDLAVLQSAVYGSDQTESQAGSLRHVGYASSLPAITSAVHCAQTAREHFHQPTYKGPQVAGGGLVKLFWCVFVNSGYFGR